MMELSGSRLSPGSPRLWSYGSEPRSIPSADITRLRRYYGPLRLPDRPVLSLADVRLSSRDSSSGGSRVASVLRLQACRHPYPGGTIGGEVARGSAYSTRSPLIPTTAAFPKCLEGRLPRTTFLGLLDVHCTLRPACSPHR
jgi:hypothetical protein